MRACLLVTRPDPAGAVTARRAAAMGLDVRHFPLFEVRALPWSVPDATDHDALLLTSAQAVRWAGPGLLRLSSLPVYAVGAATAQAAEAVGLAVAETGTTNVQSLLDAVPLEKAQRILWLCGRDRSPLDAGARRIEAIPCYAADPVAPPPEWDALTTEPAVLLAYSTRSAERLAALTEGRRGHLALVAISAPVAVRAGDGWHEIAVAARPDDAAMLAEAHALCHKGRK